MDQVTGYEKSRNTLIVVLLAKKIPRIKRRIEKPVKHL